MVTEAKQRSASQKIGHEGELVFELWASDHELSPHKTKQDLGIDYFCERLSRNAKGLEEPTGSVMAVQVRATVGKTRQRVILDRKDVQTALRLHTPYCLIAVASNTRLVYFRFLDLNLLTEWAAFLGSSRKYVTQRLDRMSHEAERFASELTSIGSPAFRHKFAKRKLELELAKLIPGAALQVNRAPEGDWALVAVKEFTSILAAEKPEHRKDAAGLLFRPLPYADALAEAITRYSLQSPLREVGEFTGGPLFIAGPAESRVNLFVEQGPRRETSRFLLRRAYDERAYIGSSGLVK